MDFLKSLFESGALNWEQFQEAVSSKGYKIADLSTGNYVSKKKYEDDILTKDNSIADLKGQITTRDTDITGLKKQIEDSGIDAAKIAELNSTIATLQTNYETQKTDYEKKLASQNYEFAVKEFAGTKKFSSNAAKRDFIQELIAANLPMQDKTIMGADDFTKKYSENNSDAFVKEKEPEQKNTKPTFVQPTPPTPGADSNPFNFGFTGVR